MTEGVAEEGLGVLESGKQRGKPFGMRIRALGGHPGAASR